MNSNQVEQIADCTKTSHLGVGI